MDNKIKIDNSNFYNLPNWEMEEILSTTHYNFWDSRFSNTQLQLENSINSFISETLRELLKSERGMAASLFFSRFGQKHQKKNSIPSISMIRELI